MTKSSTVKLMSELTSTSMNVMVYGDDQYGLLQPLSSVAEGANLPRSFEGEGQRNSRFRFYPTDEYFIQKIKNISGTEIPDSNQPQTPNKVDVILFCTHKDKADQDFETELAQIKKTYPSKPLFFVFSKGESFANADKDAVIKAPFLDEKLSSEGAYYQFITSRKDPGNIRTSQLSQAAQIEVFQEEYTRAIAGFYDDLKAKLVVHQMQFAREQSQSAKESSVEFSRHSTTPENSQISTPGTPPHSGVSQTESASPSLKASSLRK